MLSIADLKTSFDRAIWETELDRLSTWQAVPVLAVRIATALGHDLVKGQLTLYAMSLVYTTLLSLVPLLAVSFSVLKGFGVHNQIEPLLAQALAPLGTRGAEIAQALIGYVDKTNVAVLGSVGLAILIYSVVSLISKIEQVFNATWHVEQPRPLVQRFSQYLSVLLIGPVLFFAAVGSTASVRSDALIQEIIAIEPFAFLVETAAHLIPLLLITLAFTFAYKFVPNTRVRLGSALIGALVAGLLWQIIGSVFATFMAGSTRYAAIYSGLAIVILFMIWVYIAWLILLVGASIAFYHQHPEYLLSTEHEPRLSNRVREHLALEACALIARRFHAGDPAPTATRIARELMVPRDAVLDVLETLEDEGLLVRTVKDDDEAFVPGREPRNIPLARILKTVRRAEETREQARRLTSTRTAELAERVDNALETSLEGLTLADLADQPRRSQASRELAPTDRSGTR